MQLHAGCAPLRSKDFPAVSFKTESSENPGLGISRFHLFSYGHLVFGSWYLRRGVWLGRAIQEDVGAVASSTHREKQIR